MQNMKFKKSWKLNDILFINVFIEILLKLLNEIKRSC